MLANILEQKIMRPDPETKVPALQLDSMVICPNSNDSLLHYADMVTIYAQKKLNAVFSKRAIVPFPGNSAVTIEDIPRLYLMPFGPLKVEENPSYSNVYSAL